jgi:hypothetical protein
MGEGFTYQGQELELFQSATNWKKYFSGVIRPFIHGKVVEAGAGIGSNITFLDNGSAEKWLLLEPDKQLSSVLNHLKSEGKLPPNCDIQTGTIGDLTGTFDTIIYIDVLEHIQNDKEELNKAAGLVNPGGNIIVLSPAFQHLFSPFDKAIGHYRRYNKKMMENITPDKMNLLINKYYDSAGYFASLLNKALLRKKYPTQKQVMLWDKWLVPISRVTDMIFLHSFGKSIISVWQKPALDEI